jgi:prepilin-type N-terminal cleavage/methylation domain-containing protein
VRRESGFTLLEVLVTLTVLAIGVTLTLSLISGSLGNIRKVRASTRTIEQAQSVMELALVDDSIKGATTQGGDFEDGTRWSVVVTEVEMPMPANLVPALQPAQMPVKVFSYLVEIMGPNSTTPDFRLQTLKLANVQQLPGLGRIPQ